jgi:hypothetical protein
MADAKASAKIPEVGAAVSPGAAISGHTWHPSRRCNAPNTVLDVDVLSALLLWLLSSSVDQMSCANAYAMVSNDGARCSALRVRQWASSTMDGTRMSLSTTVTTACGRQERYCCQTR